MMKSKLGLAVACAMLSMGVNSVSFGQDRPQQPGGDRGERGNFDPAAMRERMNTMMKERLGASDEEWKVIQPRLEKVQTAQRATSTRSGFGGFGGGGDRGGRTRGGEGGGDSARQPSTPETPLAKAASELRQVTENKEAAAADVKAKLEAYRAAKNKAKAELAAAQKELTEILTPKQEAVLVSMGTLD